MDIERVIEDGTQVGSFVKIENLWGTIARRGKKTRNLSASSSVVLAKEVA